MGEFCKTIFNQPLWGNDHIYVSEKNKCKLLFFKNWMNVNIFYVGNLKFSNGILDEEYVHHMVKNKANILIEIGKLKKALKPYREFLGNYEPVLHLNVPYMIVNGKAQYSFNSCKSKLFYKKLVRQKAEIPLYENMWKNMFSVEDHVLRKAYYNKVFILVDKKIAEFNFKVLQNILPCNSNLVKWRKAQSRLCRICNVDENLMHMLFSCKFANGIWRDFMEKTGVDLSLKDIVLGTDSKLLNSVISIISYSIFKQWTQEAFHNVLRNDIGKLSVIKCDIVFKATIYKQLGWNEFYDYILNVVYSE